MSGQSTGGNGQSTTAQGAAKTGASGKASSNGVHESAGISDADVGEGESEQENFSSEHDSSDDSDSDADTVRVEEASDEELDAAWEELNQPRGAKKTAPQKGKAPKKEAKKEEDENEASDSEADEDSEESQDRESKREGKAGVKERRSEETVESLERKLRNQERANRENQLFIQRQNQRYGDLAKEVRERIAGIERDYEGMTALQQNEAAAEIRDLRKKLVSIDGEKRLFEHVVKTREEVEAAIPEKDWSMEDMIDVLEEDDDHDPDYVARFRKSPYMVAHSSEIRMIHKAGRYKMLLKTFAGALKMAKKQIEELKKKPEKIVENVERVAQNSVGVTGKNGGGRNGASRHLQLSDAEIAGLSNKELDELWARLNP